MFSPASIYPEIIISLRDLYGIQEQPYDVLWDNENIVLGIDRSVVRITPPHHRTKEELNAELDLLRTLHSHSCAVANVISSNQGNLDETILGESGAMYVTVFERLPGVHHNLNGNRTNDIVRHWGWTMGKIHRVTSENELPHKNKRLVWEEEIIISKAQELVPEEDSCILRELYNVIQKLEKISKDTETYWLVHTDMRPRNFAYHNWKITHFDFDDICHHWFVYDIAVTSLHETEELKTVQARTEFLKWFLWDFLEGYLWEKTISNDMFELIILFMKLRCIYSYIDYYKRLKIKNVDSGKEKMQMRRWFILNFDTFIDTTEVGKTIRKFINQQHHA